VTDNASAGATPVAAGATPAQTPAAAGTPSSSEPPKPPATGSDDDQQLGHHHELDVQRERKARKAAEAREKALQTEYDALKASQLSDADKAIAQARKDGAAEAATRLHGRLRSSEVRSALAAAGINPGIASLAARADEFDALKVSDDGEVEGLDEAIAAFKKSHGDLFKPAAPAGGSGDTGTGGGRDTGKPTYTRAQIGDPAFWAKNKDDILLAQREGRITA